MSVSFPIITGDSAGFATEEEFNQLADGVTSISTALGTTTANLATLDTTVNNLHIPTDRFKWQDIYDDELVFFEELAAANGLMPDPENNVPVTSASPYTAPDPYGGLFKATAINQSVSDFTTVTISNGDTAIKFWTSQGGVDNVGYIKYLRVQEGYTITVGGTGSNVCTYTPAKEDVNNPTRILLQKMQAQIDANKQMSLDINARMSNKKPSGTMTPILTESTGSGYIVPENNGLGGRIHGKGINAILGSTGVVNVQNAEGTIEVYNNLGLLSLLAPVPVLVEDVTDGDIVTSSGMAELSYEPYIAG